MPNRKSTRAAQGSGTIRKKTVTRNGQPYTYWEARITTGRDPGTGKQIQKSFTGKTQKEVREKMQAVAVAVNEKTYIEPSKLTLGQWLDIWGAEYLGDIKPLTLASYKRTVKNHIKPALGAIKLQALSAHEIQGMYNAAQRGDKPLAPKTIKNLHGVTHKALQQAVELGYIKFNPADACKLPRAEKRDIKPLDEQQIKTFLQVISGHKFEYLYLVTLFTGMREGEVLGLTWDCIDFKGFRVYVCNNILYTPERGVYEDTPKTERSKRYISLPAETMRMLKRYQTWQFSERLRLGEYYQDQGFVFAQDNGKPMHPDSVTDWLSKFSKRHNLPHINPHAFRHTMASMLYFNGVDSVSISKRLGHAQVSTTANIYAHVMEEADQKNADILAEIFLKQA